MEEAKSPVKNSPVLCFLITILITLIAIIVRGDSRGRGLRRRRRSLQRDIGRFGPIFSRIIPRRAKFPVEGSPPEVWSPPRPAGEGGVS